MQILTELMTDYRVGPDWTGLDLVLSLLDNGRTSHGPDWNIWCFYYWKFFEGPRHNQGTQGSCIPNFVEIGPVVYYIWPGQNDTHTMRLKSGKARGYHSGILTITSTFHLTLGQCKLALY